MGVPRFSRRRLLGVDERHLVPREEMIEIQEARLPSRKREHVRLSVASAYFLELLAIVSI